MSPITLRPEFRPWIIALAAVAVGAAASVYAAEMALATSARPLGWLPIPLVYDVKAARLFRVDPRQAQALELKAVALKPVDSQAWVGLAATDVQLHGRLGEDGRQWLARSYDAAPYDAQLMPDRLALAYDAWPGLTPDLRQAVLSEFRVAWSRPELRNHLMSAVNRAHTPAGKLRLGLEILQAHMRDTIVLSSGQPDTR
jgi:hypothetical protein